MNIARPFIFTLNFKGPFIFYEVVGAGGIWGGHPQKNGLQGGGAIPKKTEGRGGGVTRNIKLT